MRRFAALALAALLAGCAHLSHYAHYEIVGYYAGWKDPIAFDARDVTVVNYAFVDFAFKDESPAFARLVAMKPDNPQLRVMASIGGWTGSGPFSNMAGDAASRAAFIDAALRFLRRTGFDGIDLDWEYPTQIGVACAPGMKCESPEDKRNFVALAREMRAAFDAAGGADGKRYLITIAAGADAKFIEGDWLPELARSLDWINLMTYDYHGSLEPRLSGLNAPLRADARDTTNASAEKSVDRLLELGIPARKITLGLPFYGKSWEGCAPGPRGDGLYQPCERFGSELMLPEVRQWVNRAGFERHWSEPGRVPYVYNPASRVFITYEDERSIRDKTWFARMRGLRGVMFWELGSDDNGVLRRVVAAQVSH